VRDPRAATPTDVHAEAGKIGKLGYARLASEAALARETKIQRSADGAEYHQIDAVPGDQLPYDDASRTGPEQGKTYWYRVKSASAGGESGFPNVVAVEIPG
jgi:hypothetical protein